MSHAPRELEYDLFVSWARTDNEGQLAGKIAAFVQAIVDAFERQHRIQLRVYFDERPPAAAGDHQDAVLRALDRSTTILAILSAAYFDSPWCKREWERHLGVCRENGLPDVPFVSVAIADNAAMSRVRSGQPCADWIDNVSRQSIADCRRWWPEWKPPTESDEIRRAIGQIADAVYDCLNRIPDRLTPVVVSDSLSDSADDLEEPLLDRPTACSMPDVPQTTADEQNAPIEISENVQFTVFRPRAIPPSQWRTLLAFAHLAELPPEADPHEPDPLEEVQRLAKQVLGPDLQAYGKTTQDSMSAVPRQGLVVFLPTMEGIEFNPPRYEFQWIENVHKAEFRLRASSQLEGKTARGRLTVFLGSLILAEIPLQIRVDSLARAAESSPDERATARPYRNIFASYSHADVEIVRQFEDHAKALGDRYLRDVVDLRAGQVWNDELMRLIEEATVFQLFWSHNAMRSPFVRQEWEYALSLRRPDFIRPTYWESPFPEVPEAGLPPDHLRRIHFHFIGTQPPKNVRSDAAIAIPSAGPEGPGGHAPLSVPEGRNSVPAPLAKREAAAAPNHRRTPLRVGLGAATAFVLITGVWLLRFSNTASRASLKGCREMGARDLKDGRIADAREWFVQGLGIAEDQARARTDDPQAQRDWSTSLRELADLELRDGKFGAAEYYLQRDLQIWRRFDFNATPLAASGRTTLIADAKAQMSQALERGDASLQQRKNEDAVRSFRKYLETADRLAMLLGDDSPSGAANAPRVGR